MDTARPTTTTVPAVRTSLRGGIAIPSLLRSRMSANEASAAVEVSLLASLGSSTRG